jgi:hypothetical protein
VFKASHRAQPQALCAPAKQAPTTTAVARAATPRRSVLRLRAILEAFSWLGEMRAMPFIGLEPGIWYDGRQNCDD